MCYVHNQWYDISCAILYIVYRREVMEREIAMRLANKIEGTAV